MANYLLGAFGIIVSVGLFLVGYRQTIGARKERITSANADLTRILLRRVVLEDLSPARDDIERLRDGKSREFRVGVSDMLLAVELMNTIYTQIVENDFISPDVRKGIIERIRPFLERLNRPEELEPEPVRERLARPTLEVMLGLLASALGAATSVIVKTRSMTNNGGVVRLVILTASISFVVIGIYLVFNRLRDEQNESPPRVSPLRELLEFERTVAIALRKSGLLVHRAPVQSGYDWQAVTKAGAKILVEVKGWPRNVPASVVRNLVERLSTLVTKEGAKEALLVVREPLKLPPDMIGDSPVKIVSFRELGAYLGR